MLRNKSLQRYEKCFLFPIKSQHFYKLLRIITYIIEKLISFSVKKRSISLVRVIK
jgi:hypothetical protein